MKKIDTDSNRCLFSFRQIEDKINEMYPDMKKRNVTYHVHEVMKVTYLHIYDDVETLQAVIKEQVEKGN